MYNLKKTYTFLLKKTQYIVILKKIILHINKFILSVSFQNKM